MSSIYTSDEHYEDQDEKYYLNLPLWPKFAIHNKTIDGMIPSCRVESWEDFDQVVKHYCDNDTEGSYVFRGQKHYKWQLEPTLDRLVNGAVTRDVAEKQLHNFRLSTRGRINDKAILRNDSELWALGQHHGLATPLLDWSLSPYVALFFAFEGEDDPTWIDDNGEVSNYSRTIFVLNKSFIQDLNDIESSEDGEVLKIVEPSIDDHGRLVNQAGLFTFAPYGEILESALEQHLIDSGVDTNEVAVLSEYICRIHIPNEPNTRNKCLKKLHKMNIHHASLFPDLIGASGYCNDLIREALLARKARSTDEDNSAIVEAPVVSVSTPSWDKHRLESTTTKSILLESLIIEESIRGKISPSELSNVVDDLLEFINQKAGVDWYKKEPVLARLRNIVRRQLRKTNFPDDFISPSANALISKAADMSKAVESMSTK
ncbi:MULTISPECIES: FRG domain-containing protein [unclassified Pseudoalteromonas]|uniref:FRG domain-containing protein n=1 Tax=unclassified Pseudoalteromonas TaxID=194690 RepID=UPI00209744A0|nr:FRG domain-containing protein [Pseudoalteromonas sp. XMcav2-N]MCO7188948.1 FRG domain-containing protein [Pseudoalteromonas sp. XMcav2-N]